METRLLVLLIIVASITTSQQCSGRLNVSILYGDSQIERVQVEGINLFTAFPVATSSSSIDLPPAITDSQAGENGVLYNGKHYTYFLPLGNAGKRIVALFDGTTERWTNIDVNCEPVGLAERSPYEIVGFCAVNTTFNCVPYFRLAKQDDDSWVDVSGSGLCSYRLSTTNLTNPVIMQYESQYGYAVKLYFAEQGTNRLHEIDLGEQETNSYDVPDYGQHQLKVTRLVPAIATDGSFTGLRLESSTDNSDNVYHVLFSSTAQSFSQKVIQTETVAFDSNTLNYLVSFTANHKTMIVISEDGTTRQYKLSSTLDDPILCENMVGSVHSLICLADKGLSPLLINVNNGTSKIISVGDLPVARIGKLTKNTFYLLNIQQEMLFYALGSDLVHLGRFTVHSDNLRIMSSTGDVTCDSVQSTERDGRFPTTALVILVLSCIVLLVGSVIIVSLVLYRSSKKSLYVKIPDNSSTSSSDSNGDPKTLEVPDERIEENNVQRSVPTINQNPSIQANAIQPAPSGLIAANLTIDNTGYVEGEVVEPKQCSSSNPAPPSYERMTPIGGQPQEHLIVIPRAPPLT